MLSQVYVYTAICFCEQHALRSKISDGTNVRPRSSPWAGRSFNVLTWAYHAAATLVNRVYYLLVAQYQILSLLDQATISCCWLGQFNTR